jgi:hypothetical protein
MSELIDRANKRIRAIEYEISRLQNEKQLLDSIAQSENLGFPDVTAGLLEEYRKFYKK